MECQFTKGIEVGPFYLPDAVCHFPATGKGAPSVSADSVMITKSGEDMYYKGMGWKPPSKSRSREGRMYINFSPDPGDSEHVKFAHMAHELGD